MITNELLEEKWKTQKRMVEEAGYDVHRLLDRNEQIVKEMAKAHGIRLKYSTRKPASVSFPKAARAG